MGEHKSYEKHRSWVQLLLCFLGGSLLVAACLCVLAYYKPGIIGAHATGKLMGFGLVFMAAPFWAYFRRRKRATRQ